MLKKADIGVGLYLLAAVVFFIVPIPSVLLDVMLAFNISIALIIVFNVLFVREVLDMSFFPTLLLFTTIFRISLNVSSTRLILLTGDPGNVVKTFGSFVGGGNMVVGSIVFIVLVLIQFIVINKGSERVSEVTARFTLDAMPGKQMAIDADLNTGAITDAEAKERREKIQRESSFFGAMDGATKYVKGDATAGLVITFINLIGGTIMGVMNQGLGFADAIQQYGLLTIGDGLVSQIPSLLISLATGILVTKGSNEADFSGILVKQLFGIPRVLYIVGSVLVFLGIFTPLNPVLFIALGLVFIIAGKNISKNIGEENIEEEVQQAETEAEEIRKPENVVSLLQVDPIELEFGYGIIPLADVNQGGDLLDRVVMIRRQIALELGTVVPIIRLRDNIQLNPNQYIIKIKGVQVTEGEILFDHYMAMNPGYVEEEITGIPTFEPSFHLPAIWITEAQRCTEPGQQLKRIQSGSCGRTHAETSWPWRDSESTAESFAGRHFDQGSFVYFRIAGRSCTDIQRYGCADGICKAESEACNFEQIFPVERNDQCHYARSESGTGDHVFGQADRAGCISDDGPGENKSNYGFRADRNRETRKPRKESDHYYIANCAYVF